MGLLQGATEFLPVSSSGHLGMFESLLGIETEGVLWEVALHVGTLAAVVLFFWRDIRDLLGGWFRGLWRLKSDGWRLVWSDCAEFRYGWYIVLGTLPAALAGVAAKRVVEQAFASPILTAAMIFITGEVLWLTRPYSLLRHTGKVRLRDSLVIGLAQAVAILPGISRSGSTISAGLMCGVEREQAARFSFLLAVPVILGAALLEGRKITSLPHDQLVPLLAGVGAALVSGIVALWLLLRIVRAARLHWFAWYCWAVAVAGVLYFWAASRGEWGY